MTGADIKQMIKTESVKLWQVAELWGVNDSNFSRRLRKPFNAAEVEKIKAIIKQIKAKEKNV